MPYHELLIFLFVLIYKLLLIIYLYTVYTCNCIVLLCWCVTAFFQHVKMLFIYGGTLNKELHVVVPASEVTASLTRNVDVVGSSPIKAPVVFLSKKHYPYCLELVGSRNGFDRDFTFELK